MLINRNIYIFPLLGLLILGFGCRNVDKMVEEGDYDRAIRVSVNKLVGKDKRVKYVKALERSFNRANAKDLNALNSLIKQDNRSAYSRMINLTRDIVDRQELVTPLTPLIAENGYRAKLDFIDVNEWNNTAVDGYLKTSWNDYQEYIQLGREGNTLAAREAYDILLNIMAYDDSPEVAQKLREAKSLGTTYLLFKMVLHESSQLNDRLLNDIRMFLETNNMRDEWTEFHYAHESEISYDGLAELAIRSVFVSPGDDQFSFERVQREVQVGEKAQRDSKGNPVVDTSGNVIMIPIYENVRGEIINVIQYKEAAIEYEIRLIRRGNSKPFRTWKETAAAEFQNAYIDWRGDRRAFNQLPERGFPAPYPADQQLLSESVRIMQDKFESTLFDNRRAFIPEP